jgi:hypothetical protein
LEFFDQNLTNPERSSASPYLSAGTAHSARPSYFTGIGGTQFFCLFFWFPKTLKKRLLPERPKISKIHFVCD